MGGLCAGAQAQASVKDDDDSESESLPPVGHVVKRPTRSVCIRAAVTRSKAGRRK